ncbi:MAG: helix-turn-helix transcriptional regulator [Planctomycetes bacterium]|nr:helix-turn-helix transcriptional regulator [Planctomycetota bacterium]
MVDKFARLTAREREVFLLTAEGCTRTEIAKKLFISPRTAEAHRASAMRKLGLHNRPDLIRYAIQRGIIPVEN